MPSHQKRILRRGVMNVKDKDKNYFAALYDVVRVIHSSLDVSTVLQEIVKAVVKALDVKASSIRLLDSRRKALIRESGLDQKVLKGELIYIKNAQTSPDFQYGAGAKTEGIKSVIVAPLITQKKVIGVLRVYTDKVRDFNNQEIQFLEAVANLSALALDNARLHQVLQTNYDLLIAHKYRLDDN
jgi:GAF domain-containing protein